MDIKRLNNGNASWPQETSASPTAKAPTDSGASLDAVPAGALDKIRAQFTRSDLATPKFESILRHSINALLDSAASASPMPSTVRQKVSDFLAADPLFAGRVRVFWEKNLN